MAAVQNIGVTSAAPALRVKKSRRLIGSKDMVMEPGSALTVRSECDATHRSHFRQKILLTFGSCVSLDSGYKQKSKRGVSIMAIYRQMSVSGK